MKKYLLLVSLAVLIAGYSNQVMAQCAGANVTITNISVNTTATHYVYSFIWTYNNGNASIQVRFKCGTNYTYEGRCFPWLKDSTAGAHFVKDSVAISAPPVCPAPALKQLVIGIWTNNSCGGLFCEAVNGNIPLPVKFAAFNASRNRGTVNLTWTTAQEKNNTGFAVERNTGGNWEQVAFVPSQALGGNSDISLNYSYMDVNNNRGISQYRIRQVDLDSKSSFSEIRAVRGEGQLGKTIVYPNPSKDGRVNIVFEDAETTREISIADMSGRIVRQIKGITSNNIMIDNLNPGMYTVRIAAPGSGEQVVEKLIVNKR